MMTLGDGPAIALAAVTAIGAAAVKGALVALVGMLVVRTLLRERSAASRHAVWVAVLAAHVVLLVATPVLPAWRLPVTNAPAWLAAPEAAPGSTAAHDAVVADDVLARSRDPGARASGQAGRQRQSEARPSLPPLAALWLLGVLGLLARYVAGTRRVARLARESDRVEDGAWLALAQRTANRMRIARPLTLLRGGALGVPVTWGIVYPAVLLPADSDSWPDERRELVLVHEMAHVKRLDALTQILAQIAEAVFWFDPLVWYAGRQARFERERACDDWVLRQGARASFYADELLTMVRRLGATRDDVSAPAFAALAMARRGEFEGRMLAILDPKADRTALGSRAAVAMVVAAAVVALPLAAVRPFVAPRAAEAAIVERGLVSMPRDTRPRTAHPPVARIPAVPPQPSVAAGARPRRVPVRSDVHASEHVELLAVMRRAAQMTSDGDKAALLRRGAPRYFVSDDALRAAFFATLGTIGSSGDRAAVLRTVIPLAKAACDEAMLETIHAARGVGSDGDRAAVLIRAARAGLLVSRAHRETFVAVARTIASDADYRSVMEALLGE